MRAGWLWGLVVLGFCGCQVMALDGASKKTGGIEVEAQWMPVSTAIKLGTDVSSEVDGVRWTGYTRPDFGVQFRMPSAWETELVSHSGATLLSFSNTPPGGSGYDVFGMVLNPPTNKRALEILNSSPQIHNMRDVHGIDQGESIINGMRVRFSEWVGAMEGSDTRVHLIAVLIDRGMDKPPLAIDLMLTELYYTQNTAAAIEMIRSMASLDPVIAARAKAVPAAPVQASWPTLDAPHATVGGGEQDAAVIVGIEDYFVVSDIPGARRNANAWFDHLRQTRGVPMDRVRVLRDGQGTREEIEAAIEEMAGKVGAGGTLWVVFIGHGAPMPDGSDGLLVGVDAQQTARSIKARSLSQKGLVGLIEARKPARAVLILDACFSGQTANGALVPGLQPMVPVKATRASKGVIVLSAGAHDQFAGPLPGADRPAFSYLLLGALRGWADANADRTVTTSEAILYTRRVLGAALAGRVQTPELLGDDGATLSKGAAEAGPDINAILRQP